MIGEERRSGGEGESEKACLLQSSSGPAPGVIPVSVLAIVPEVALGGGVPLGAQRYLSDLINMIAVSRPGSVPALLDASRPDYVCGLTLRGRVIIFSVPTSRLGFAASHCGVCAKNACSRRPRVDRLLGQEERALSSPTNGSSGQECMVRVMFF